MKLAIRRSTVALFCVALLGCGDDSGTDTAGGTSGAGSTSGASAGSSGGTSTGGSSEGSSASGTSVGQTTSSTSTSTGTGTGTGTRTGTDTGTGSESGTTSPSTSGETEGGQTECGAEFCDVVTEICVERAEGGPSIRGCEPVPDGCEADRTCACVGVTLCTVGLAQCTDVDSNFVFCDSGLD